MTDSFYKITIAASYSTQVANKTQKLFWMEATCFTNSLFVSYFWSTTTILIFTYLLNLLAPELFF